MDKKTIISIITKSLERFYEWSKPLQGKSVIWINFPRQDLYRYYTEFCELISRYAPKESKYFQNAEKIIQKTNIQDLEQLNQSTTALYSILIGLEYAYNSGDFDNLFAQPLNKTNLPKRVTYSQVFISHSQDDENLKDFFNKAFASSPVRAVYEEYEKLISGEITVDKIKQDIDNSKAVFVLLSENVENKLHTRDWIAFEAGYAFAKEKDVWIFEPSDKFGKLNLITPGLTHYMPIYLDDSHFPYLRHIIDSYKDEKSSKSCPKGIPIECLKCHSKYTVHSLPFAYFRCPVCNEKIFIRNEDGKITTGSAFVDPEERLILYDPESNTNVAVYKRKKT